MSEFQVTWLTILIIVILLAMCIEQELVLMHLCRHKWFVLIGVRSSL